MKIAVSGVAGFLGAHIAREAVARGWEAVGIDSMLSPALFVACTVNV